MKLFIAINGILGFTLINVIREAMQLRRYPEAMRNAETIFLWTIAAIVLFNGVYFVRFLISRRRRIADQAITAAAAGVRAKRAIGSRLSTVKQQVIDRADRS